MGRPTLYSSDKLSKAEAYLTDFTGQNNAVIPSIAGLATYLEVSRDTIYEWAKDEEKSAFSDILGKILSKQEELALNGGLTGDLNATIVKLLLGKHGYSEKQDTTVANPHGQSFKTDNKWTVEFVNATPES